MKIQENAQNYWGKIVCTPICLWSGCPPTLPFMLQAIMDMDDGVTDDEEKRRSLKQLYKKLSDIDSHMCVVAHHTMFKEQRKYIPSLETLQYCREFMRNADQMGVLIDDIDIASVCFKVHPEVVDMDGKIPSSELSVMIDYGGTLDEALSGDSKAIFLKHRLSHATLPEYVLCQ